MQLTTSTDNIFRCIFFSALQRLNICLAAAVNDTVAFLLTVSKLAFKALVTSYKCLPSFRENVTLYSIKSPFDAFEIQHIRKYYGKWSIFSFGANAPFSIIFSIVFKALLKFILIFSMLSKLQNDVMI